MAHSSHVDGLCDAGCGRHALRGRKYCGDECMQRGPDGLWETVLRAESEFGPAAGTEAWLAERERASLEAHWKVEVPDDCPTAITVFVDDWRRMGFENRAINPDRTPRPRRYREH